MKWLIIIVLLVACLLRLTGCNTVNGIGRDLQEWSDHSGQDSTK